MFKAIYNSEDLCYEYIKKTDEFILTSRKYKISFVLSGDFAKFFQDHLKLLFSKPNENLNKNIERLININLFYGICSAIDEREKNNPRFTE